MTTTAGGTLHALLSGDVGALRVIGQLPHDDLLAAVGGHPLIVTRRAVASVLRQYIAGEISAEMAQQWASFVRRGYAAEAPGPIRPIDMSYERAHESAVLDCLMRLDELGDVIDGEISAAEADELLRGLE